MRRGARIGILGRNGAGKTTLIRTLVGELAPLAGEVSVSRSVRVGYFAQQGVDRLRGDETALAQLQRLRHRTSASRRCAITWAASAPRRDTATRPVGPMSGGEKARLSLALMLHDRPQLLVLDEPTNHLDAQARDALTEALADFDGAVLLVSHDRYLLRATADTLLLVSDATVREFDGDLDDYADWLMQRPAAAGSPPARRTTLPLGSRDDTAAPDRRDDRRVAAQRRAQLAERLRPLAREVAAIETRLAHIDSRLGEIEARLADPDLYRDAAAAGALGANERRSAARRSDSSSGGWSAVPLATPSARPSSATRAERCGGLAHHFARSGPSVRHLPCDRRSPSAPRGAPPGA